MDNLRSIFNYPLIDNIDDDLILLANTANGNKLTVNDRKRLIEKYQDDNNDALEFLGDTVLELIVADFLFNKKISAGLMTKISSVVVRNVSLICLMNDKNLCNLNTSVDKSCADLFEAYMGAVYIHLKQYENINIVEVIRQWAVDVWDIEYMINYAIDHPDEQNICHGIEKKYEEFWDLDPPNLDHVKENYKKLEIYYNYFHLGQIDLNIFRDKNIWVVRIKCPMTTGCQFFVAKTLKDKFIGVGRNRDKNIAIDLASKQAITLLLNDYMLK